jgi:hypothetical protein
MKKIYESGYKRSYNTGYADFFIKLVVYFSDGMFFIEKHCYDEYVFPDFRFWRKEKRRERKREWSLCDTKYVKGGEQSKKMDNDMFKFLLDKDEYVKYKRAIRKETENGP